MNLLVMSDTRLPILEMLFVFFDRQHRLRIHQVFRERPALSGRAPRKVGQNSLAFKLPNYPIAQLQNSVRYHFLRRRILKSKLTTPF